jgi:exonuclease III
METKNNNPSDIKRVIGHYVGMAEVVTHYSRYGKDGTETLKIKLKLHDDFFSYKHNKVVKNHVEECTVYGKDSNHIEYKKQLKTGDLIRVKLDYENTKHKFHDYIIRGSQVINPAIVNNGESDDTLGNWM